ncbi:CheR family methyltransferase [Pseudomonas schmalbachii]|uniref:Chemotaxis protein methyltransferase n=1 Tax=Pseudomonas schmalbachii TaxID=2816993 RepID=A0ABS3TN05_9PSED|nr:protein-glutamate O-methyltransferase CheR [Pseudomonas schmalbachii]MBO3274778.1 protein-glutamate O-methyltransferase CheR [Pseudomonas schmalbachii]
MSQSAQCLTPGLQIPLGEQEFRHLQRLFHEQVGLQLPPVKKPLICGRLSKRLNALRMDSYQQYYQHLVSPAGEAELEIAIDLITTHETYFFREPKHFDFLQKEILPRAARQPEFRAWSAASSTGEEAYTLAMLLDNGRLGQPWTVLGTDISQQVLTNARRGLYSMGRGERIPTHFLKRYCLKGRERYDGYFLVERQLRERVEFRYGNLTRPAPELGMFDLVLLRNVLIYFDQTTKERVLSHVLDRLKPGGWLMVGHSEALHEVRHPLELVTSSIYRKVAA